MVDNSLGGKAGNIRQTWLETDRGPWSNRGFRLNRVEEPTVVRLEESGRTFEVIFAGRDMNDCAWVERVDHGLVVTDEGVTRMFNIARPDGGGAAVLADGAIVSPMPGKIIALEVAAGDEVTKGQKLLTLEAMKMEHSLTAPFDGKVAELNAEAGAQVSEGALLVRIEKGEE